jgi:CheY-like chemotaxis protein
MSTIRILAIDDDDMVLNYLSRMLSVHYTILTCNDPHIAISIVNTEQPDLILCDIDMPEVDGGMIGAALAANANTANIPLIYLTSIVSQSEVHALDGIVGGRPGISKRASLPELIAAIESQLLTDS